MLNAEIDFLLKPNQENLAKVYGCCSNLRGMRGGYWGESGTPRAERVSQHYQERFGDNYGGTKPEVQDVAVLLENIRDEYQLEFLATIMLKKDTGESEEVSWEDIYEKAETLKNKISISQAEELRKAPINPKTIEDIFSSTDFRL